MWLGVLDRPPRYQPIAVGPHDPERGRQRAGRTCRQRNDDCDPLAGVDGGDLEALGFPVVAVFEFRWLVGDDGIDFGAGDHDIGAVPESCMAAFAGAVGVGVVDEKSSWTLESEPDSAGGRDGTAHDLDGVFVAARRAATESIEDD